MSSGFELLLSPGTLGPLALRTGTRPELFGPGSPGTYLAVYFVIAGKHDEHFAWGLEQVRWLHANDRMFAERDHVHTLLYDQPWSVGRDDDGVPPELALDHPYTSLVAQVVAVDDDADLHGWLAARRGETPAIGQTIALAPVPLADDAPVTQVGLDDLDRRRLLLRFADATPAEAAAQAEAVGRAPGVELLWSSPFRPTIPGTDTFTDQLW